MRTNACKTARALALAAAMTAAAPESFGITATKAYVDKATNAVLVASKEYADSLDLSTAEAATNYTDKVSSETLNEAKGYADTKATDAVATAKSYTDTKAEAVSKSANTYTDTKASDVEKAAKEYTDGVSAGLVPNTRKVNDHSLDDDIYLTADDVNAIRKDGDIDLKTDYSIYNALEVTVEDGITVKNTVTTGALTVKDGEVNLESSSTLVKLAGDVTFTGTGVVDVQSGTFTANDVVAGDARFEKLSYSTGVVVEGKVVYNDVKDMFAATDTRITGVSTLLEGHKDDTDNPHGVTAKQVGAYTTTEADEKFVPLTAKGANGGVATLDSAGLVPSSQLPSYVDDVLEFDDKEAFPEHGESGKIYVAIDTNLTYRWGGTEYVEISPSLALGETESTAYAGDKGKANADAITALRADVNAKAAQSALDGEIERASGAEKSNSEAIAAEAARAKAAEGANADVIATETSRATAAEAVLQSNIDKKADASALGEYAKSAEDFVRVVGTGECEFAAKMEDVYFDVKGLSPTTFRLSVMIEGRSLVLETDDASKLPTEWTLLLAGKSYNLYYRVPNTQGDIVELSTGYTGSGAPPYAYYTTIAPSVGWMHSDALVGIEGCDEVVRYAEDAMTLAGNGVDHFAAVSLVYTKGEADSRMASALSQSISETSTTFSTAVLSVTKNIDTEVVASINELLETGSQLPTTGVVSVGAALAAFAAALAKLKSNLAATDAKVSAANTALEEVA